MRVMPHVLRCGFCDFWCWTWGAVGEHVRRKHLGRLEDDVIRQEGDTKP